MQTIGPEQRPAPPEPAATLLDAFRRQGACWPLRVCDADESAGFGDRYRAFQAESVRRLGAPQYIKPHLVSTWMDGLAHCEPVLDLVERILGEDILLWYTEVFAKPADGRTRVCWHQDAPYWELSDDRLVTAWLALTPSTVENGCMHVHPGSHTRGVLGTVNAMEGVHDAYAAGRRSNSPDNLLSFDYALRDPVRDRDAVPIELQPGEISLHHIHVVHGGGPNPSGQDRVGLAMRFISARTRCLAGRDSAMLVRGAYTGDDFDLEPRPVRDFDPAALATLKAALSRPSGFGDRKYP